MPDVDHTEPMLGATYADGLPAGDATGAAYEGVFWGPLPPEPLPVSCECVVGTCPDYLQALGGTGPWSFVQQDGRLTIYDRVGQFPPCKGGVDAVGTFWCGNLSEGHVLVQLIHGKVSGSGDQRVLDFTLETSARSTEDEPYDCDVSIEGKFGIF